MKLIDISRPIRTGMPHWPGDSEARFDVVVRIRDGAPVNVGALRMSVHNGTHADAPWHYNDAGATIDLVPVDTYVGPARVIDARGRTALDRSLFAGIDLAPTPRILFRTDAWTDPGVFPTDWPVMEPGMPQWLAAQGVKLVGLDIPSVDTLESKDLPIHHACDHAGICIIENLDLRAAGPGTYELIALPLRIAGGDGSPIRAVLRSPA